MFQGKTFVDSLIEAVRIKRSILVGGLDPQIRYMPPHLIKEAIALYGKTFQAVGHLIISFNMRIIDAIAPHVPAVKPQIAFYEDYGMWGLWAFEATIRYARSKELLVITDAKRGDGGDTADAYADGHLGKVPFFSESDDVANFSRVESPIRSDCLTINGYIGDDCVTRFVKVAQENGTGIFVVDKTSFKPNSALEQLETKSGLKVWQEMAKLVDAWGQNTEGLYGYRNVGVVMGATYAEDAPWMRMTLPKSWFLVPGYGGQGATADDAVVAVKADGLGCLVNNSRNLIYAYLKGDFKSEPKRFAEAASNAAFNGRNDLNAALERAGKLNF